VRNGALPARQGGRDYDYELWALPAGAPPVSLGVLPATGGASRHALSSRQLDALAASMQVAVSIEPAGGSPTGQPTGPVVLTAPLSAVS
jgi:anti-sigma-K factor RskA